VSTCTIFFFIDAMGAAVVRDRPVIADLAPVRALRSVLGYSSACVPSILSGRFPEQHQHWSYFTYRGPGTGLKVPGWLQWLPSGLRDRGRVRHQLSKLVGRANGIHGYFQMYLMPIDELHQYGHCEPRDIFTPGGMNTGGNIADVLQQRGTMAWKVDWKRPLAENWAAMRRAAADPACTFLLMYDGALDAWLHDHTRHSPDLDARLRPIRTDIDAVLAIARAHHDQVNFHIFSDHGMCTVRRHVDLFPRFARSGLRMHHDYHCVIDSTMVRLWFRDPATRATVLDVLSGVDGLRHLDRDFMAKERCAFPDNRFGDEFFLADPGVLLVPSHLGKKPLAGMHGYSVDHEDSDASYLTNDPTAQPRCIVDLYGLMERAA